MTHFHSFVRSLSRLLPTRLWLYLRQRPILQEQAAVAAYWAPLIARWEAGELTHYALQPKQELHGQRIIWQYWGQGYDPSSMPEVVRIAMASVDYYAEDWRIIRLSDETLHEWIELPDFVQQRLREGGGFNRTFLSDLLRVALLATYGGVWLDATILLTAPLPEALSEADFFAYQRDSREPDQLLWRSSYYRYYGFAPEYRVRMLNSILFARTPGHPIYTALLDFLLYYWEHERYIRDYFFFQILFHELVQQGSLAGANCPLVSDTLPHLVQKKLATPSYSRHSFDWIFDHQALHKMSYYDAPTLERLKALLRTHRPELAQALGL